MRVLLDENLPIELATDLADHEVHSVTSLQWAGVKNSELLARARGRFQALRTMDSNLEFQQRLAALPFGVVIIRAPSNRLLHLRPLVPAILAALNGIKPGEVRQVSG